MAAIHKGAFDKKLANKLKLVVGNQAIRANKYILMAYSDVFRTKFERWAENGVNELVIENIEYEPMLSFVMSMYSGEIKLPNVNFGLKVMSAVDFYHVDAIKSACGHYQG